MMQRLGQFAGAILPLTAGVSLLCGPSPSAAWAGYTRRLIEKRNARHAAAGGLETPSPSDSNPSRAPDLPEPAGTSSEKKTDQTVSSFVPPSAAKPAEARKTGDWVAPIDRPAPARADQYNSLLPQTERREAHLRLHRPCYRATAPPLR